MKKFQLIIGIIILTSLFGCTNILSQTDSISSEFSDSDETIEDTTSFFNSDCFEFEQIDDGYALVGINDNNVSNIQIPSSYEGESVVAITNEAFSNCQALSHVIIPSSVTKIGNMVFSNLTNPLIIYCEASSKPDEWDDNWNYNYPVYWNYSADKLVVQDEFMYYLINSKATLIKYIGTSTRAIIPTIIQANNTAYKVSAVGDYAFYNCRSLLTINVPKSVLNFSKKAVINCDLVTIYFESTSLPLNYLPGEADEVPTYLGANEETCIEKGGIIYLINDKKAIITKYLGIVSNLTIPSTVQINEKSYDVTTIGSFAFGSCSFLTDITIPSSITDIGSSSFIDCDQLKNVTFEPKSKLKSIGNKAFYNCHSLTSIAIPSGVTSIGEYPFSGCTSLESITLPFIDAYLGNYFGASSYNDNSTYVPKGLKTLSILGGTSIPEYAFYNCNALTNITISSNVTKIGENAFVGCTSLESVTLPFIDAYLGYYFGANSYNDNPTYVPKTLKTLSILGGQSIPEYAFYSCNSLIRITIPSSIRSIGKSAFSNCSSLNQVNYDGTISKWISIDFNEDFSGLFIFYASNPLSMKKLYIDEKLYQEENIVLEGIDKIGSCAFAGCDFINTITIKDGVTSIGACAFRNCSSLTSIIIPNSVTSIEERAFYNCSSLTIFCEVVSKPNEWDENWNSSCPVLWNYNPDNLVELNDFIYYIYDGVVTIFKYNGSSSSVIIQDEVQIKGQKYKVTNIDNKAFSECSSLTNITIPSSVTNIGDYAFSNCNQLQSVKFEPNSELESIGEHAFSSCSSLTNITIPSSVTNIGVSAFFRCTQLQSVTFEPNSELESIKSWTFAYCYVLSSITIQSNVVDIGIYAFAQCNQLQNVIFAEESKLESIGEYAFVGCRILPSIIIPNSVVSIGEYAFGSCDSLTIYCEAPSKPEGWNNRWNLIVDTSADVRYCPVFWNYKSKVELNDFTYYLMDGEAEIVKYNDLSNSVTIQDEIQIKDQIYKVTIINSKAFYKCSFLTEFIIPNTIKSIGYGAFCDCNALTTIIIPNSVISMGRGVFFGCSSLTVYCETQFYPMSSWDFMWNSGFKEVI